MIIQRHVPAVTLNCRKATSCFLFEYLLVFPEYLPRNTVSYHTWLSGEDVNNESAHICIWDTSSLPFGSAVKRYEDNAMASSRAIVHDDRNAVTLFSLAYVVCILALIIAETTWMLVGMSSCFGAGGRRVANVSQSRGPASVSARRVGPVRRFPAHANRSHIPSEPSLGRWGQHPQPTRRCSTCTTRSNRLPFASRYLRPHPLLTCGKLVRTPRLGTVSTAPRCY